MDFVVDLVVFYYEVVYADYGHVLRELGGGGLGGLVGWCGWPRLAVGVGRWLEIMGCGGCSNGGSGLG